MAKEERRTKNGEESRSRTNDGARRKKGENEERGTNVADRVYSTPAAKLVLVKVRDEEVTPTKKT